MFDLFDPVVGIQSSASKVWRAVSDPRSVKALDVAGTPGARRSPVTTGPEMAKWQISFQPETPIPKKCFRFLESDHIF